MEGKEEPTGGPHFVGTKAELIEAKRSFRTMEGRDILVIYHEGVFHALDSYCYHSGGKLQNGDIEELGGRVCIICPRHKYKISLAKGEGIYKSKEKAATPQEVRWLSKGVKQRVHTVTETNGDVYVTLRMEEKWVESDYYQGEDGKVEREKAEEKEKEEKKKKGKAAE